MFFLKNLFNIRDKFTNDQEKPFLDHLEDLRKMLVGMIVSLVLGLIIAFLFMNPLVQMILYPLNLAAIPDAAKEVMSISPPEAFVSAFKICFFAAIALSFPFLLYFLAEFVVPGLTARERKMMIPVLAVGTILFLTGLLFCYFVVMPRVFEFFHGFGTGLGVAQELRFGYVVSFVTQLCLIFGLAFEMPVVIGALLFLDILSYDLMKRSRRYAIVIIFIISAVVTPTPDAFTLSLLAGPLIILYEVCIWMAWVIDRRRKSQEAAEAAQRKKELQALVQGEKLAGREKESKMTESLGVAKSDPAEATPGPAATPLLGSPEFSDDNDTDFALETETPRNEGVDPTPSIESAPIEPEPAATSGDDYVAQSSDDYGDDVWAAPMESHAAEEHPADSDGHDDYQEWDDSQQDYSSAGYFDDEYHRQEFRNQIIDQVRFELKEQLKKEIALELTSQWKAEINEVIKAEVARQLSPES